MKRLRSTPHDRTAKLSGMVSAAALMLGVSHAATVGFNFTANYCSAASYSGAVVTAPAFGIGTNGWQSLTEVPTGYGCAPGPFTFNEVIDTTTSGGGLNPLPIGSLNVSWTAYVANVSGFGGYDRSPPHYTFSGNSYRPGEEQVYWGFLRDGVNFGPGSSGGDNDQPGWSVDITGLKSVFTNGPFVVEMIAAGDSISALTNVFVIDAALSATQSVFYPNIPPIANVGDTAWPRGIGGGLSTASGPVNTDHLSLVGNRAEHSAGPPAFNNASQVAGFIITDQPVITMPPQSALVGVGDNVTLRTIAIGVPPVSLQWRQNGTPIAGATNVNYNIPSALSSANYDVIAANAYGSTTSKVAAITVDAVAIAGGPVFAADSKPVGTPHDGLVLGATWVASDTDFNGTNRTGVASFNANDPDQITVSGETTDFDGTNGTIVLWLRSGTTPQTNGTFGSMLFDRYTSDGNGLYILELDSGNIAVLTQNGETATSGEVFDDNWHMFAITYNITNGTGQTYFDGQPDQSLSSPGGWNWPIGQEIELGKSHTATWEAYNGLLDDVRIYSRQLTGAEIASVYATGALVDTNALKLRLNFDKFIPGLAVSWQLGANVLQSATSVTGPYTDVTGATSPYQIEPKGQQTYYRYRHSATNVITNPYDM